MATITNQSFRKADIVALYDPCPLDVVSTEKIRSVEHVDFVTAIKDEAILVALTKKNIKFAFQTIRFEYTDDNTTVFLERDISHFAKLIQALPSNLKYKAIGINLFMDFKLDGVTNAGEFIRDKFLLDKESIKIKVEKDIIAHSIRLFYGSKEDHNDLRITPLDLIGNGVGIQLHRHKDVTFTQTEQVVSTTTDLFKESYIELNRVIGKLLL